MHNIKGMSEGKTSGFEAASLVGIVFLSTLGVGIFAFAIPLLAFHEALSGLLLGATFSGYFLAKLIISPIAGRLSDSFGPRPLLITAALVGTLAPLATLFSQRLETLYVVQFCLGLSSGTMKTVATAAIGAMVSEEKRGQTFGLCNALYNAAFFLGPILGGLLFYDRDLLPVIIVLTVCMAISLIAIVTLTDRGLGTVVETSGMEDDSRPLNRFQTASLMAAICGRTMCTAALITFYPVLLAERLHGPNWLVGLVFAVPSIVACLFLPFGGRLADRFDKKKLIVIGMAGSSLSLAMAGMMQTSFGFLLVGVMLGIGTSLSFPAATAMASLMGKHQGRIMGWFHGAANVGFVIGPILCGVLVEQFKGIPTPMAVVATIGLILVLPMLLRHSGQNARSRSIASAVFATIVTVVLVITVHGLPTQETSQAAPAPDSTQTFAGIAMGNIVNMTLLGVDAEKAAMSSDAAFDTIARLEKDFGHRNPDGSVGRVNMAAGGAPETVSRPAFELIERALAVCHASSGTFDITIGAVTVLPYYYQEKAEAEKAPLVDYRKIVLDADTRTVFLPEQGMALDLGGLAKGTVMDGAAETLRKSGVPTALVEAGGDLFCYGDKVWKVGIQNPRGEGLLGVISVSNAGVCGSGDYYQYVMTEDQGTTKRKHHILDPGLLDSADESIAVTVIAPTAELADALATTLFILGPVKGEALLSHYDNCSALWILPDETLVASKGFPPMEK